MIPWCVCVILQEYYTHYVASIHTQCNRASKPCVYTTCLYDVEDGDVAMVAVFESWSGHHYILWL